MNALAKQRTLLLNNDYSGHSVVDWQRAISLMIMNQDDPKDGAYAIELYPDIITDTSGQKYPLPSVMVLAKYVKRKKNMPFSRKNILLRDKFCCQYCGKRFKWNELTYDHVIPRCQYDQTRDGTPTHWENIVACCQPCNRLKAGRTPQQAKMKLIKQPVALKNGAYIHGFSIFKPYPKEWEQYVPDLYKAILADFNEKGV